MQLNEPSVKDYGSYIPIGNAPQKIKTWANQGAEIVYLSSNKNPTDLKKDKLVLKKYQFPKGEIYFRQGEETYADVAERVMPDILIEDDCESIGGKKEMTFPHIESRLQKDICSVVVPEFEGIDMLPNNITALAGK